MRIKQVLMLAALCLILCGCGRETAPETSAVPTQPEVKTLYVLQESVTTNSDGSVLKTVNTYDNGVWIEQLVYYQDALQSSTAIRCDEYGRPVQKTDNQQTVTTITYDDMGNLLTSTTAFNGETVLSEAYTYDSAGNPLTRLQTNSQMALDLRTVYEYQQGMLVKEETYAGSELYAAVTYSYEAGKLVTVTDLGPDGKPTSWQNLTYDTENRVTTTTYYDVTGVITGTHITTYDQNGCPVQTEMTYGTATMTTVSSYLPVTVAADCPRK